MLAEEYASLDEQFSKAEGYEVDVKIRTILNGMGFADKPVDTVIHTLSGGEKTRLALAKLLLEQPTLLILDEPTNHLDFKTLTWLEEYLSGYRGALLLVSHDRDFLDACVDHILSINRRTIQVQAGNFSTWQQNRQQQDALELQQNEKLKKEIRRMEEAARRTSGWSDAVEKTKKGSRNAGLRPDRG